MSDAAAEGHEHLVASRLAIVVSADTTQAQESLRAAMRYLDLITALTEARWEVMFESAENGEGWIVGDGVDRWHFGLTLKAALEKALPDLVAAGTARLTTDAELAQATADYFREHGNPVQAEKAATRARDLRERLAVLAALQPTTPTSEPGAEVAGA